jgi:5'-3' exonuclease
VKNSYKKYTIKGESKKFDYDYEITIKYKNGYENLNHDNEYILGNNMSSIDFYFETITQRKEDYDGIKNSYSSDQNLLFYKEFTLNNGMTGYAYSYYGSLKVILNVINANETDDESFERQRSIIQEILDNLYVRQFMYDDVEGDDLIAYYCKNKKQNERIVIVSEDSDITQLINDEICIWIPSIHKFITPNNDVEELGYTHENVVLKKIICGDASDNIYGIKGVAEKGLLKQFPDLKDKKCTLNEILERCEEIQSERTKDKKKPLKSLENILNRVTDGCQGKDIFEINEKIIDLSVPLLTEEAENELKIELYAPIDPDDRDIKNVYKIIYDNDMKRLQNETIFGNVFGPFERICKMEKKYFAENHK